MDFAFLTLVSFFSVSDILSEADNVQRYCVALTLHAQSESQLTEMPKPH